MLSVNSVFLVYTTPNLWINTLTKHNTRSHAKPVVNVWWFQCLSIFHSTAYGRRNEWQPIKNWQWSGRKFSCLPSRNRCMILPGRTQNKKKTKKKRHLRIADVLREVSQNNLRPVRSTYNLTLKLSSHSSPNRPDRPVAHAFSCLNCARNFSSGKMRRGTEVLSFNASKVEFYS